MTEKFLKISKFKVHTAIVWLYLANNIILNPKLKRGLLFVGIVIIGCDKPPELPTTPSINFESVRFATGTNGFDSLIVVIGFEDGNGDLGLLGSENQPPYHPYDFQINAQGDFILFGDPEAPSEFHVCDFVTDIDVTGDEIADTAYIVINQNSFNIEIDFFLRRDGAYEEFDWRREFGQFNCITFDGRYPILNSEDFERPLAGSLSYSMVSSGFLPLFGNDTLQLRIEIKDRALNISNTVESQDFVVGQ